MDTLRGNFADGIGLDGEGQEYDPAEDDTGHEAPPASIGQDERRMQVRAYNHWASLLEERNFPCIEDLDPENLDDFGPYSVLLDFTSGIENPGISYLGDKLAQECGANGEINKLSDVPSRSLLSRITDHYMQILANQAPIGFEAEFVNQRGITILYRGILLPFSTDDDSIDFIYGVINWKELADQNTADELLLEIDQALETDGGQLQPEETQLTDWADGPSADVAAKVPESTLGDEDILDLATVLDEEGASADNDDDMPHPSFGKPSVEGILSSRETEKSDAFGSLVDMMAPRSLSGDADDGDGSENGSNEGEHENDGATWDEDAYDVTDERDVGPEPTIEDHAWVGASSTSGNDTHEGDEAVTVPVPPDYGEEPAKAEIRDREDNVGTEIELAETDESDMGLWDWLASARELAESARSSEDRTRQALYTAIGRAYDFSIAAAEAPEEFEELVADAGLTTQDRAPMTPVVKLVFGADYDKTRITEYSAALSHGHRLGIKRGKLGEFLTQAKGGLKGVVASERRLRREESGQAVEPEGAPRERLAKKLRAIEPQDFDTIETQGNEFALVMIRRLTTGEVVMLGEIPEDVALLERAARKLVG